MSRNKAILILGILVAAYFIMPNYGIYHTIKVNAVGLLPFALLAVIVYLVITINVLKHAWKKLDRELNDKNTIDFAKIMNISFDTKRMLGSQNLQNLYSKVSFSQNVSLKAKKLLYEAMRRKRLDVPQPGKGDANAARAMRNQTHDEMVASRIAAAAKAKQRKRKK